MVIALGTDRCGGPGRFVCCTVSSGEVIRKDEIGAAPGGSAALAAQLVRLCVDLYIGTSPGGDLEFALSEAGIASVFGADGDADTVLDAYLDGRLFQ